MWTWTATEARELISKDKERGEKEKNIQGELEMWLVL
jgi:hypothetical protein